MLTSILSVKNVRPVQHIMSGRALSHLSHLHIPVAGPFDRVGADFIKFPKSKNGNQYAIVFVDYLTSGWRCMLQRTKAH